MRWPNHPYPPLSKLMPQELAIETRAVAQIAWVQTPIDRFGTGPDGCRPLDLRCRAGRMPPQCLVDITTAGRTVLSKVE